MHFACIINDKHRAAGRSGVGAVMGSKNLKAVAVRGTGGVKVADPKAYRDAALESYGMLKQNPVTGEGLRCPGHPGSGQCHQPERRPANPQLPDRNLCRCRGDLRRDPGINLPETQQELHGLHHRLRSGHQDRRQHALPVMAKGRSMKPSGRSVPPAASMTWRRSPRPTISAMKPAWIPSPLGATVGCAMELFEKGLISEEEIGMPLNFGDATPWSS